MKLFKKCLPFLLIFALLLPVIATAYACPACPGYNDDFFLVPEYYVSVSTPNWGISTKIYADHEFVFPDINEPYSGYDFLGWTQFIRNPFTDLGSTMLYQPGEAITITQNSEFYALFGKRAEEGYEHYTTEIDSVENPFPIGHTLSLGDNISINFLFKKEYLQDCRIENISFDVHTPISSVEAHYSSVDAVMSDYGDYICYTVNDLNATQMTNSIRLNIKLVYEDGIMWTKEFYSIADYAYSQLSKTSTSDSLKALCANLLQYGAMAQLYKGYRTSDLADANLTDAQRAYCSDLNAVSFDTVNEELEDLSVPSVQWIGKTLDLQSTIALNAYINCSNYPGSPTDLRLKVRYTDVHGTENVFYSENYKSYNGSKNIFYATFAGLPAADLRTVLELCVVDAEGTQVSTTVRYSMGSYGNGKTGDLLTLCQALMAYSDSAAAFIRSK